MGQQQCSNAAVAASAALWLGQHGFPQLSSAHIARGLAAATLLGRFQVCTRQLDIRHSLHEQCAL